MKKISILFVAVALFFSSCATIMNGTVTEKQRTKPAPGQPQRKVYAGYLIADILFGVIPVIVDFATGAIYKREPQETAKQ